MMPSMRDTFRGHWRTFLPLWLFGPVFFVATDLLGETLETSAVARWTFSGAAMGAFFWVFFRGIRPFIEGRLPYRQSFVFLALGWLLSMLLAGLVTRL